MRNCPLRRIGRPENMPPPVPSTAVCATERCERVQWRMSMRMKLPVATGRRPFLSRSPGQIPAACGDIGSLQPSRRMSSFRFASCGQVPTGGFSRRLRAQQFMCWTSDPETTQRNSGSAALARRADVENGYRPAKHTLWRLPCWPSRPSWAFSASHGRQRAACLKLCASPTSAVHSGLAFLDTRAAACPLP